MRNQEFANNDQLPVWGSDDWGVSIWPETEDVARWAVSTLRDAGIEHAEVNDPHDGLTYSFGWRVLQYLKLALGTTPGTITEDEESFTLTPEQARKHLQWIVDDIDDLYAHESRPLHE